MKKNISLCGLNGGHGGNSCRRKQAWERLTSTSDTGILLLINQDRFLKKNTSKDYGMAKLNIQAALTESTRLVATTLLGDVSQGLIRLSEQLDRLSSALTSRSPSEAAENTNDVSGSSTFTETSCHCHSKSTRS